jgi:hypothetical protein
MVAGTERIVERIAADGVHREQYFAVSRHGPRQVYELGLLISPELFVNDRMHRCAPYD